MKKSKNFRRKNSNFISNLGHDESLISGFCENQNCPQCSTKIPANRFKLETALAKI